MIPSFQKKKIKGFTLLEILIVVAILGILIVALIPRIGQSQARANDVRRKVDLQEVTSALMKYKLDHGSFPDGIGGLDVISGALKSAGMTKIPKDPIKDRIIGRVGPEYDVYRGPFIGMVNDTLGRIVVTGGQYGYTSLTKNGIPNAGFVLIAHTETEGGSNRIPFTADDFEPNMGNEPIIWTFLNLEGFWQTRSEDIQKYKCNSLVYNRESNGSFGKYFYTGGVCEYKDLAYLLYIYVY